MSNCSLTKASEGASLSLLAAAAVVAASAAAVPTGGSRYNYTPRNAGGASLSSLLGGGARPNYLGEGEKQRASLHPGRMRNFTEARLPFSFTPSSIWLRNHHSNDCDNILLQKSTISKIQRLENNTLLPDFWIKYEPIKFDASNQLR
jgi:hypothetical protein